MTYPPVHHRSWVDVFIDWRVTVHLRLCKILSKDVLNSSRLRIHELSSKRKYLNKNKGKEGESRKDGRIYSEGIKTATAWHH